MESLLKYHIQSTEKRFDELNSNIKELSQKMDNVNEFKVKMIASSRTVSFIISAVCGAITLLVSVFTIKH